MLKPNLLQQKHKNILKNAAVPFKDSHDKNKSNENQNSENKIGSPNPTNEVSENISDTKNTGVLDDAEILQKNSNTSQGKKILIISLRHNLMKLSGNNQGIPL